MGRKLYANGEGFNPTTGIDDVDGLREELDALKESGGSGDTAAIERRLTTAEGKIDALQGEVVEQGKEIAAVGATVNTLQGTDTGKSVREIAAEETAKIVGDAPENYDTLKEIADYISSDATGAAELSNKVSKNAEDIANLDSNKLGKTEKAADSAKLNGIPIAYKWDGVNRGIPFIESNGVMEFGRIIDFHIASEPSGTDYATRLRCQETVTGAQVYLPSTSGTLALTTDNVASATKLATPRTLWGQSFDGTEDVDGDMTINGTMTATATYHDSDERLKTFEGDVEVDLEKLKALPKKYFHWTADANGKRQLGTSAQAVEKLFPELVSTDADDHKSVNYANLSIVALAAVDKLAEQNAELAEQNAELERRLARIEKLLNIE